MQPVVLSPPALMTRSDAVSTGLSDAQLRGQVARCELVRLRRGTYQDAALFRAGTLEQRHLAAIAAAVAAQQSSETVVSHQSAAVLHGLPVWSADLSAVHVTKQRRNAGRRNAGIHVHGAPLDPDEVTKVGVHLVTSPTRTVIDLALTIPFEGAVVAADAALHRRLTTTVELLAAVDASRGRHGLQQARSVIAFADRRSESVGESRSRWGMRLAGIRPPGLQHTILRTDGSIAARSDFDWDWLLGEFDGISKYGRQLRPGEAPGDAVVREKHREDEVRALGYDVIRWTWNDLAQPKKLYARIAAKIASCDGRLGPRP